MSVTYKIGRHAETIRSIVVKISLLERGSLKLDWHVGTLNLA